MEKSLLLFEEPEIMDQILRDDGLAGLDTFANKK